MTTKRWAPIVGVVAVILAAAAALQARELLDRSFTTGTNVLVNRPRLIDAHNSPSLARNPVDEDNLALTYRVDRPGFSAELSWSSDGGSGWRQTALPLPASLDRPYAPDLGFDRDGTLYVSYVNLVGEGNVPDSLWVARSIDGGRTLSDPVRVATGLIFQARLAVGPEGNVYVTWMQAAGVGPLRLTGSPNPIVAARSTDGGRSFSGPVQVSDPERQRVAAATPVVDSTGRLVVLYQDFKSDQRDFQFLEGPPAEEPFALVITSSSDSGMTFSRGAELESNVVPTRRFLVFLPEFPSVAVGPDDELYVSWADGREGDLDVFIRRSEDGGASWFPPVRVNDNPTGDGTSQFLPRVAVTPSGKVRVLFLDRRRDPDDVVTEAYAGLSDDHGQSFRNHRLSSEASDARVGPYIDPSLPVDFGSRLGLVADDDELVAAWTDTRFGTEDTGRQDVMATVAGPREASPREWTVVAVLALGAILAVGGAVRVGRRSAGDRS